MMRRRHFIHLLGVGMVGCHVDTSDDPDDGENGPDAATGDDDGGSSAGDGGLAADACMRATVLMHDTNAQALYLDGSFGPLTGVIEVAFVIAGATRTLDFWHGHGGQLHRFTLEPAHYAALAAGERVYVTTTAVDDHMHMLFIDPLDEDYRVRGAPDVAVPVGDCA